MTTSKRKFGDVDDTQCIDEKTYLDGVLVTMVFGGNTICGFSHSPDIKVASREATAECLSNVLGKMKWVAASKSDHQLFLKKCRKWLDGYNDEDTWRTLHARHNGKCPSRKSHTSRMVQFMDSVGTIKYRSFNPLMVLIRFWQRNCNFRKYHTTTGDGIMDLNQTVVTHKTYLDEDEKLAFQFWDKYDWVRAVGDATGSTLFYLRTGYILAQLAEDTPLRYQILHAWNHCLDQEDDFETFPVTRICPGVYCRLRCSIADMYCGGSLCDTELKHELDEVEHIDPGWDASKFYTTELFA